jgi:ubiquitin carboxyl-terminal hydrolase L5
VYHFVSFVPFGGKVYELDGLKRGPVIVGEVPEGVDWVSVAMACVKGKLAKHSESHEFNLMAVVRDRVAALEEELAKRMSTDSVEDQMAVEELQNRIQDEVARKEAWKTENVRRKHNYIPFLVGLLKALADKNLLIPLLNEARAKQHNRK